MKTDLIPAIIQDSESLQVLMLGYMNKEALKKTLQTKRVTFWSRSRKKLWQKGESSGNFLKLVDLKWDCDCDTILIKATAAGPTCHTGKVSCFSKEKENGNFLKELESIINQRKKAAPKKSYTAKLFQEGLDQIAQKVGEEAVEFLIAGKGQSKQRIVEECADLFYHTLVLLAYKKVKLDEVMAELARRHKK